MQTPDATLHSFVLQLLSDADLQQAFDANPVQALSAAGLPDVAPQDVLDAVPLVMDFASASDQPLSADLHGLASMSGVSGWGGVDSGMGGGSGSVTVGTDGVETHGGFGIPDQAGGNWDLDLQRDNMSGEGSLNTPLGSGNFAFDANNGFDGEFHLSGLDSDVIGKGGDLVTGTVAGFVTDGASTFSGMLTEGAGALTQHVGGGAETLGGLITDGAGMLADGVADPTSLTSLPAGLPADLPVSLPALPATPSLPDVTHGLPLPDLGDLGHGLPSLPGLGDLGHALPQLPVDLPVNLPDVTHNLPALPAAPALPSLPGVDAVHDTVAGLTSNVPLVGDLTDGVTDHLGLLGH